MKTLKRAVALLLVVAIMCPVCAGAAQSEEIMPLASDYLSSYNAYVCPMGSGKIEVWYKVCGTDYMDDLGALTVRIYESTDNSTWSLVKVATNGTDPAMLGHNDYYYSYHIDYQGVVGRYYKAYVTIWAGCDGGGDSRYVWTSVKTAT